MTPKEDPYKGVTVLIVEDDATTRSSIRSQLRQIGIPTIIEAADGKAGLNEVARTRPTMVLCDVHMKPVDGRQFLKMVRTVNVEWVKNIPIIFITADANPETVSFAKEYHVNGYIVKPISVNDLRSRIELYGDDELTRVMPSRQGIVELKMKNGRELKLHVKAVRGTSDNPMKRSEVDEKSFDLLAPIIGKARARKLCDAVWNMEKISDVRKLRPLLQA